MSSKRKSRFQFSATTSRGTEEALATEFKRMGLQKVLVGRGVVEFTGKLRDGYRALLWSRIASRILVRVGRVQARDADELYRTCCELPWEEHLAEGRTFAVRFVGRSDEFRDTRFGGLVIKDAIVDRLRKPDGTRPDVDPRQPDLLIHAHLSHATATIYIDISGAPLHYRGDGGRVEGPAPMRETLAAAMLQIMDYRRLARAGVPFLDPFCGSGTILLEAAGIAADFAPGLNRSRWGFTGWSHHDQKAWDAELEAATNRASEGLNAEPMVFGSDIDPRAVDATIQNAERMGLRHLIKVTIGDAAELTAPHTIDEGEVRGLLVTNPPYGGRLGQMEELLPLYSAYGDRLRRALLGWKTATLLSEPKLGRAIGLKPSARHKLYNGPIECRLLEIEISTEAPKEVRPKWRQPSVEEE